MKISLNAVCSNPVVDVTALIEEARNELCTTCCKPFHEHTHIYHGEDVCPDGEGVFTCEECPHD